MSDALQLREVTCPLCGADRYKAHLHSEDLEHPTGSDFRLVRCLGCGHVYLSPAPTPDTLSLCYPAGYGPHRAPDAPAQRESTEAAAGTPEDSQPWYLSPLVRGVPGLRRLYYWLMDNRSQVLPPVDPEGRDALELGCATGRFLAVLRECGWNVTGVDLVQSPVDAARARGFNVHLGNLQSARFDSEQFDDVFAWMVIEHLPDPVQTIGEIFRIQRPGGWFCFSIPNFASPERWLFGKHWKGYDLPRHLQHFTPARIRRLLEATGYQDIRVIHQADSLYWIGSLASWLLQGRTQRPSTALRRRCGQCLWRWYVDTPPLGVQLMIAPAAKFEACLRLSGRLTILARKPREA